MRLQFPQYEAADPGEIKPGSFDLSVRIVFAASGYVQIMVGAPDGYRLRCCPRYSVLFTHVSLRTKILLVNCSRSQLLFQLSSNCAVKLHHWKFHPEELVGKDFISTEAILRRVFLKISR